MTVEPKTWRLVTGDDALQRLLAATADCDTVMVDTEFMRRNTFFPEIALLQLCFAEDPQGEHIAWLIDPLELQDLSPLIDLFEDRRVLKVLHSASEDLEVFNHWLGVLPQPLFDTQRAAALIDHGFGVGYRTLVQSVCDVDLPKGETRSNWLQRPLTESQCEYAGLDVTWLLPVWRWLNSRCQDANKMEWVLSDGADATAALASLQGDYYRRIKSAWKLDTRQLGRLEAISRWREQTARRRNKPRSWIVDDKACLAIAQQRPQDHQALARLALPEPVLRRHGDEILEVLEVQDAVPEALWPARLPEPLDARGRDHLKRLKSRAKTLASALGVAPEVLLSAKDYEQLLREAEGSSFQEPIGWSGWRANAVIAPLREFLSAELGE